MVNRVVAVAVLFSSGFTVWMRSDSVSLGDGDELKGRGTSGGDGDEMRDRDELSGKGRF